MDLQILSPVAPSVTKRTDRMVIDDEEQEGHLVTPGETITSDQQFMRYGVRSFPFAVAG